MYKNSAALELSAHTPACAKFLPSMTSKELQDPSEDSLSLTSEESSLACAFVETFYKTLCNFNPIHVHICAALLSDESETTSQTLNHHHLEFAGYFQIAKLMARGLPVVRALRSA